MHIKKLEISGFKSFVDRTVVHFDHDVVGIVGPNGCGKSNIVDAIRWCIGEQSAKHLRGRSMSDVIFAGSSSRGPHGMAEVTLTFDNSDPETAQGLPLEFRDYAEIAVTRRLYRDGTSEYAVNKTPVRLKDVTDLFLGTGVGTKAYSIIEQGKVGLIVSARAEDRRMIIEEAAGITKYKARRKQAEAKMDQTRQNLLRVGDIVSEIERNLASLKRQAAKAERYISYKAEVEDLTLCEASQKLLELTVCAGAQEQLRCDSAEREEALVTDLARREAEIEVKRQETLVLEDTAEKAQTESFHANNTVRTHEGEISRGKERYAELSRRSNAASIERTDLAGQLSELRDEHDGLLDALASAEDEEIRGEEAAQLEASKLSELRTAEEAAERAAADLRKKASTSQAEVARLEATLRGFEQRFSDMSHRREALEEEDARLTAEVEDVEARAEAGRDRAESLAAEKQERAARRDALAAELKIAREQTVHLDREVDVAKGELSQKRGRLRALEELHARMEGVGQGPKTLAQMKDPAVVGLVGDRFETRAENTLALAAALGDKLEWVIVNDLARGRQLLAELDRQRKGRATIVPRHPAYVAGTFPVPVSEGTIGRLTDNVFCDPVDRPLLGALVGEILLVVDEAAALAAQEAGFQGPIVTRGGVLFGAYGQVTGGAGSSVGAGLIDQRREMRELHEAVAAADTTVTAMLERQGSLRDRLSELGAELDRVRASAHESEIACVSAENEEKRAREQMAQITKRLVNVRTEHTNVVERTASAREEHEIAMEGLADARMTREALDGALEEALITAETWREQTTRQQSAVTERKVLFAQAKERAQSVRQTVERLRKSCDEIDRRLKRLDAEQLEASLESGAIAGRLFVALEGMGEAVAIAKVREDAAISSKIALDEARHLVGIAEVDLKEIRQQAGIASNLTRSYEANLARLEIERRHLVEGVREKFRGLELATVVGDYHKRPLVDASHRARIIELSELLDRMGPVNLDAVREHKEATERFTYYSTQKADLEKAISDLEQAIVQMNRECKKLFREAFDGINQRFKILFPRMFRGGQAELRLTNPEDMLETGIEILAQPPGKKLASIELMSGGEKALTAVSLIFAIFQFKPSPFCILDEVDAPLDEANVTRYNEAIRSMTDRSQFILITHIKKTMQSVDVLYGVTMQEPGVSKLVSVKVNETAVARSVPVAAAPEAVAVA
jgi:chromosome segregation protein